MKPDKITKAISDARDEDAEAIIAVCVKKIRTGADIANEITSYEAMHEPSLNTEEYKNLVGTGWISLEWLKEQIETKQKRINLSGDNKFKAIYNNALDWMFMLLKDGK